MELYRRLLNNRWPLAGGLIRNAVFRAVSQKAVTGNRDALELLAEAVISLPEPVASRAFSVLQRVAEEGKTQARELVCDLVINADHRLARDVALRNNYLPGDEIRRAIFLVLTERWEDYDSLDFTHTLLKKAYWSVGEAVRQRLLARLKAGGRADLLRVILIDPVNADGFARHGAASSRRLAEMSSDEWEVALRVLASQGRWGELVRLAEAAPVAWGAVILSTLSAMPADQREKEGLQPLIDLARRASAFSSDDRESFLLGKCVWKAKHDNWVWGVVFSPGGRLLATGSADTTARVTDLSQGAVKWTGKHGSSVWSVAFSPDGHYLATGSGDRTVRLWRVDDGRCLWTAKHDDAVLGIEFSPDGKYLASGSWDHTVRIWRLANGDCYWLRQHEDVVWGLAFSPDGKLWASSGWDRTVRVWKISDGKLAWKGEHDHSVWDVAVSPDGQYLASSSSDKTIRIWRMEDGAHLWTGRHDGEVRLVRFSPDSKKVVSGGLDRAVRVWRVRDGSVLWSGSHDDEITAIDFTPDGRYVLSAGLDRTLRLWRSSDGELVWFSKQPSSVLKFAFSPDGLHLATVSWDNAIRLWRLRRWEDVPIGDMDSEDVDWLKGRLSTIRSDRQRLMIELMLGLMVLRRRWEIEVDDAPDRIPIGEFDIEIEEITAEE